MEWKGKSVEISVLAIIVGRYTAGVGRWGCKGERYLKEVKQVSLRVGEYSQCIHIVSLIKSNAHPHVLHLNNVLSNLYSDTEAHNSLTGVPDTCTRML